MCKNSPFNTSSSSKKLKKDIPEFGCHENNAQLCTAKIKTDT